MSSVSETSTQENADALLERIRTRKLQLERQLSSLNISMQHQPQLPTAAATATVTATVPSRPTVYLPSTATLTVSPRAAAVVSVDHIPPHAAPAVAASRKDTSVTFVPQKSEDYSPPNNILSSSLTDSVNSTHSSVSSSSGGSSISNNRTDTSSPAGSRLVRENSARSLKSSLEQRCAAAAAAADANQKTPPVLSQAAQQLEGDYRFLQERIRSTLSIIGPQNVCHLGWKCFSSDLSNCGGKLDTLGNTFVHREPIAYRLSEVVGQFAVCVCFLRGCRRASQASAISSKILRHLDTFVQSGLESNPCSPPEKRIQLIDPNCEIDRVANHYVHGGSVTKSIADGVSTRDLRSSHGVFLIAAFSEGLIPIDTIGQQPGPALMMTLEDPSPDDVPASVALAVNPASSLGASPQPATVTTLASSESSIPRRGSSAGQRFLSFFSSSSPSRSSSIGNSSSITTEDSKSKDLPVSPLISPKSSSRSRAGSAAPRPSATVQSQGGGVHS
jgi:hypothetical protein